MSSGPTVTAYDSQGIGLASEIRLASGELVRIEADPNGVRVVQRLPDRSQRPIYRGSPDAVALICAALLGRGGPAPDGGPDPLKMLTNTLMHFATVADMQAALGKAMTNLQGRASLDPAIPLWQRLTVAVLAFFVMFGAVIGTVIGALFALWTLLPSNASLTLHRIAADGGSPVAAAASDETTRQLAEHVAAIRKILEQELDKAAAMSPTHRPLKLRLSLDRDGQLLDRSIVESSGSRDADNTADLVISYAWRKFPPMPASIDLPQLHLMLTWRPRY